MRTALFALICLGAAAALAGPVYKWTDENGVVHYSDQPHPDAQKVQLAPAQTYKSTHAPAAVPAPEPESAPAGPPYRNCSVAQPQDQQEFANLEQLRIVIFTDPSLRPGDQIFVIMDGTQLGNAPGGQYLLNPVERGTHTLQALVKDGSGTMVCQTQGVTFSVHQPSTQNPVNPVRPR
ncbi:MAG TPA: DUF4124 domain-containing protein [Steroidobacteraceae bacterium]|nr:DUF4124 domain-containing protein [Steroidobacteraceae bacterium]